MDRRTFLRGMTLAVGSVALAGCRVDTRPSREPGSAGESVIVIGAGSAGLAAAGALQAAGYIVTVLEARDRIGGRIWTSDALGPPVDLGASWIHGTTDDPMVPLAREAGLRFDVTSFSRYGTFDVDGSKLPPLTDGQLYDLWLRRAEAAAGRADGPDGRRSLAAALADAALDPGLAAPADLDPSLVDRYMDWIAAVDVSVDRAADPEELDARGLLDGDETDGPWVMLDRGYRAVLEPVAAALDIRFETLVTSIAATSEAVSVTADTEIFEGDRVVVTVPLGVLKAGDIAFEPRLPDAIGAAIDRLGVGDFLKVALRFPEPVWPRGMDWLGRLGERDFPEWVDLAQVTGEPIVVGFAGGEAARRLEASSDADVVGLGVAALEAVAEAPLPQPVAAIVTRWGEDPFARGSYSFLAVGATPDDREALTRPVADRLFFAGEATNRQHPCTVRGAWESGLAAADRIVALR